MKRCTRCGEQKEVSEFHANKSHADGRHPWCKVCKNAQQQERYYANHDAEKVKSLWRQKLWRHGLTREQFDEMYLKQRGACAICGEKSGDRAGKQSLVVDHDHETGALRGLLCHRCNMALGLLEDDPARILRAAAYLLEQSGSSPVKKEDTP